MAWQLLTYPSLADAPKMVRAMQTTPIDSLMTIAAQQGFWTLLVMALRGMASYMDLDIEGDTVFDVCFKMVRSVCACGDETALKYMQHRMTQLRNEASPASDLILELDEGFAALDRGEEIEARQFKKKEKTHRASVAEFAEAYKKKRATVCPPAALAKGGGRGRQGRGAGRGRRGAAPDAADRPLLPVPLGAITQEEAKSMLPPGAYIWRDNKMGSWQSNVPPYRRCSFSWSAYGHREAALLAIRHAWQTYAEHTGSTVAECCRESGLF